MQRKNKILLLTPIVIVFIYMVIFFSIFLLKKGNLKDEVDNKTSYDYGSDYGYGQTINNDISAVEKNDKYSSMFAPKFGNSKASISIIMFYDFDCSYSWKEYNIIYNTIKKYYNKGYFEFRNFPIESIHPNSRKLANAAMCANEQEKFLDMFNEIYVNFQDRQSSSTDIDELIKGYANDIDLNMTQFNKCMEDLRYNKIINKDMVDAVNYGVEGTPTFFVNGQKYPGVITQEDWDNVFKNVK